VDERFVRPAAILFSDGVSEQDEVVSSRRPNGKTFDLGGGRFRTRTALGAIHYKADPSSITEQWKPIDLAIDALGQVSAAPYTISISQTGIGYRYTSRRGGRIDVDLLQIDGEPVDVGRIRVRRDGNILFWNNAADGLDLKCQLRPAQAEVFKLLADAAAPRQFLWRVREDVRAECRFVRKTGGYDVDGDPLEVACTAFDEHTVTDEGRTYREFLYDERWTGRVSRRVDPKTRQRDWFDDPVYPCVVDATTQENIVADTDDGYEFDDNTWGYALNSWYAGQLGAWRLNSGTRFQSLGVPQGATINSATIKIKVGKIAGSPSVTVRSDDVDDAPAWSANSRPSRHRAGDRQPGELGLGERHPLCLVGSSWWIGG